MDKLIAELQQQLDARRVTIELTDAAREQLAAEGHDPRFGAPALGRVIQRRIKRRLSEAVLFGELARGGIVTVDAAEGELVVSYAPGRRRRGAAQG